MCIVWVNNLCPQLFVRYIALDVRSPGLRREINRHVNMSCQRERRPFDWDWGQADLVNNVAVMVAKNHVWWNMQLETRHIGSSNDDFRSSWRRYAHCMCGVNNWHPDCEIKYVRPARFDLDTHFE